MKNVTGFGIALLLLAVLVAGYGQKTPDRFDSLVRSDFFAGFAGDQASLERGMQTCEKTLVSDPGNGAGHVWHGSGLFFQAGGGGESCLQGQSPGCRE
jgi:hypothetical protein